MPQQSGFDQTSLTLKTQIFESDPHEALVAGSLTWFIGDSGARAVGENAPGAIQPALTFGKGFGDLPDSAAWLRPFAIAGSIAPERAPCSQPSS